MWDLRVRKSLEVMVVVVKLFRSRVEIRVARWG